MKVLKLGDDKYSFPFKPSDRDTFVDSVIEEFDKVDMTLDKLDPLKDKDITGEKNEDTENADTLGDAWESESEAMNEG